MRRRTRCAQAHGATLTRRELRRVTEELENRVQEVLENVQEALENARALWCLNDACFFLI